MVELGISKVDECPCGDLSGLTLVDFLTHCIPLVKVRWNSKRGPEFTWEREDQFKKKYPHLFTKTAPSSSAASKVLEVPGYPSAGDITSKVVLGDDDIYFEVWPEIWDKQRGHIEYGKT
ncbi:hypothetical protein Tco_1575594 [Tanacetum coccineum]